MMASRGGLVGVGVGSGAHLLEGMHHVDPIVPSRSPGPLHPAAELLQSGADHQARWAGAWGGEGSMSGVLERRGEDVDLQWWRGWRCLGERERRPRGLGVEDGYGWGGGLEGEVDMGRRSRAWWRPGEREWWWRGLGLVDGYGLRRHGEPGGACGGRGRRTWGGGGVPGGVGGSGSGGGGGWGSGSCMAGGGRGRWTWGGGGARGGARGSGSGASGWLRRGGGVGSVGAVGECAVRGGSGSAAVCGTGPHRSSRASQKGSAGPGGFTWCRLVLGGGGGGPPLSMDPPRRGVVAAASGGMGRVTVPGGVRPEGPLRCGRGRRGDTVPGTGGVAGTGGWPLAVGWVCGWSVRWLPSHSLVLFVHGGLWPGGVGWPAVVVVGVVLVVVVVGPLVVVALVVVGLVLRVWPMYPWWVFRSTLWG